jgi:hypothetical protein
MYKYLFEACLATPHRVLLHHTASLVISSSITKQADNQVADLTSVNMRWVANTLEGARREMGSLTASKMAIEREASGETFERRVSSGGSDQTATSETRRGFASDHIRS